MELTYLFLVLVSFAGGFLQAGIGFGCAMIVMAFFPLFLPSIPIASTVSALLALLASLALFFQYRRDAQPRHVFWPIAVYFVAMPFAVAWSAKAPTLVLSTIFGAFLVLLGLYYLSAANKLRIPSSRGTGMVVGLLSGILGGLFSVSSPPIALYCLSTLETKEAYLGTLQFFFLITNAYAVGVRACNGLITRQVLIWSLAAAGGLLLGLWLGGFALKKLANLSRIKRWVFVFIACTGVWIILSNFI